MLIAAYRLVPQRVVGTDVVHAAVLLWAAGIAHWVGGNVDFVLAANILIGSVPGVVLGSQMSVRASQSTLRIMLGVVLVAAGITIMNKANTEIVPYAVAVAAVAIGILFALQMYLPGWMERRAAAAAAANAKASA
jgi:uncharacterized membrane protein YqgA involved in biofilm formation